MNRALKVRVLKETKNRVTLHFVALNRKMPVSRDEFEDRVDKGLYQVIE